jgi:hypothetical protein
MAEQQAGPPGGVERRAGQDRRQGDRRKGDRRGGGGLGLGGADRRARSGFLDRPVYVAIAVVVGIAIGAAVMSFTDASRHPKAAKPVPVPATAP